MPEYAWMCLYEKDYKCVGPKYAKIVNMTKFWTWQGSQYANGSYSAFWIYQNMFWQSSEYILSFKYARVLSMQESYICHNMAPYVWIGHKYAWIYGTRALRLALVKKHKKKRPRRKTFSSRYIN